MYEVAYIGPYLGGLERDLVLEPIADLLLIWERVLFFPTNL